MFIRIQLSYNEDYMFDINCLYSVWTNKKAGEAYINGENIESCVDIGDKWLPLADIEKKFENKIKNAEKEMPELEKERLELRLTQVKRMMGK